MQILRYLVYKFSKENYIFISLFETAGFLRWNLSLTYSLPHGLFLFFYLINYNTIIIIIVFNNKNSLRKEKNVFLLWWYLLLCVKNKSFSIRDCQYKA